MPRVARLVVPGLAHHITQRGNRRQRVFFTDGDRRCYLYWLAQACRRSGVRIWAYCLMANHVHLVAVPERADSLARCFAEVHSRYARRINGARDWRGFLQAPEAGDRLAAIRRETPVCRPLGEGAFLAVLERRYELRVRRGMPGRPPSRK